MPQKNRSVSGALGGLVGLVALSASAGVLITATITPAIAVTGAAASQAIDLFVGLPDYLTIDEPMAPSTIYYLDAEGNEVELASFYDQNRMPITYDQLSTTMIDAILSSEDKNFFEHGGINLGATAKAVVDNLRNTSSRGASTITQQFVKNVLVQKCELDVPTTDEEYFEKIAECWRTYTNANGQEGIQRKLQEMRYALQIDKNYSKNDILLGYLNITNFGGTVYGIEAAANYYFGKTTLDLTIAEAATLAGIVQNPNTFRIDRPEGSTTTKDGERVNGVEDGYALAKERRNYVLDRMLANGKITQAEYAEALASDIVPDIHEPINGCASAGANAYFCQYVKRIIETDPVFGATPAERKENLRRGGLKIYTSLDAKVQAAGVKVMKDRVPVSRTDMKFGSAAVTLEVGTGRILAMVQNTKFTERADQENLPGYTSLVYAADQQHGGSKGFSVGSTYKLFTLLSWLENGRSVNEVLNGISRVFPTWTCHGNINTNRTKIGNFAGNKGKVDTVMSFTASSLNSGFFAMATQIDLCEINDLADRMGVRLGTGGRVNEQNALGDIIGTKNVPPIDIASAYATVANKGVHCTPRAIDRIVGRDGTELPLPEHTCTPVISPEVAATAAYAFTGVITGGTGTASRPGDGIPLFGKTGTHERFQTMMVASSTKTTTAVWVGNSIGDKSLYGRSYKGTELSQLRHVITRAIVKAANSVYGGGKFPAPDPHLIRTVYAEIPEVIGMNIDEATLALEDAGFVIKVAKKAVDSALPEGLVALQSPGPGKSVGGLEVTVSLSNGMGIEIPNVTGMNPTAARNHILSRGFTSVTIGECTVDLGAPVAGVAHGTSPGTGVVIHRDSPVRVLYNAPVCP